MTLINLIIIKKIQRINKKNSIEIINKNKY